MKLSDTAIGIIKLIIIISALLGFASGISNITTIEGYTSILVCIYLIMFSVIIVLTEISPFIYENFIVRMFPFMGHQLGKAIFLAILSSFCFGQEMGTLGKTAGALMLISSLGAITLYTADYGRSPQVEIKMNSPYYGDDPYNNEI